MSTSISSWSRPDLDRLLSLATCLADLTSTPDLLAGVPAAIVRHLDLEPTTLAVLKTAAGVTEIEHFATSTPAGPEAIEAARRHVLEVYGQTKPLSAGDQPALREAVSNTLRAGGGVALRQEAGEMVVCRTILPDHRLLLIVTTRGTAGPSQALMDTLDIVSGQLVRLLAAMLSWVDDPATLGHPFERLTDREWVVLQGLQSEDGEKQLADRLELSPHTLHSHIKSIYRKLGVQGRLPVLMRLAAAQRAVRARAMFGTLAPSRGETVSAAVAAG